MFREASTVEQSIDGLIEVKDWIGTELSVRFGSRELLSMQKDALGDLNDMLPMGISFVNDLIRETKSGPATTV